MAALVLSFCTKDAIWGWLIKDFSFGTRSSRIICINTVRVFLAEDLAGSANQDALEELEPVWNTSQGPQRLYEQGGYMSKVGATGSSCGALTCLEDAGRCLMISRMSHCQTWSEDPTPLLHGGEETQVCSKGIWTGTGYYACLKSFPRDFGIFMPGLSYSFGGTDLASVVDLTFYTWSPKGRVVLFVGPRWINAQLGLESAQHRQSCSK